MTKLEEALQRFRDATAALEDLEAEIENLDPDLMTRIRTAQFRERKTWFQYVAEKEQEKMRLDLGIDPEKE